MDTVLSYQLSTMQVTLVEPNIPKVKQGSAPPNPHLNTENNVEWKLELAAEETKTVTVQYTVEFPVTKEVEGLWEESICDQTIK